MLLVIDTNILINALLSSDDNSKSIRLMDDVFSGLHCMCVSSAIMEEYQDVISRPQFHIPKEIQDEVLTWIGDNALHIEPRPSSYTDVEMKDEDDRVFFDVSRCLNAKLVTRNHKHYPIHELVTLIDELY